jgi:ankyrin repeat protein
MARVPSSASLPVRPDLDQLKAQAKDLRRAGRYRSLAEAQHALARRYGFDAWPALRLAVLQITLRRRIEEGDAAGVAALVSSSRRLVGLPFADGATPLHVAAGEDRADIVDLLVRAGASVHPRYGRSGHSALSWALTCWSYRAARRLVELGAQPDLFCAAGLGDLEFVTQFWRGGRLVSRPSRTGSSRVDGRGRRLPCPPERDQDHVSDALYIACRCERVEVARWLLDHGADPNWRGYAGATCLAWAEFSGNRELAALLRERGGSDERRDQQFGATPRAFAVMVLAGWGFTRLLADRLAADPALVSMTSERGTPLHAAAAGGHVESARILLAAGADRAATDRDGRTPADVAAAAGHEALATTLR